MAKYIYTSDQGIGKIDLSTYRAVENRIYLGTGRGLERGIIDDSCYEYLNAQQCLSCAEILIENPFYLIGNIDAHKEEIEFILPENPCVDTIITLYIAQSLIKNEINNRGKKLETLEFLEFIARYSTSITNKEIEMSEENITTLYPIYEALVYRIKEENKDKENGKEKYFQKVIAEGLELIQYLYEKYKQFNQITYEILFGKIIFQLDNQYNREIEFLKKDYHHYIQDIQDKQEVEKTEIFLPQINDGTTKKVRALFISKKPNSIFFRHWAYSSPQKLEGYDLIIEGYKIQVQNPHEDLNQECNCCVIMVRKRLGVYLKGLEERLNEEEKKYLDRQLKTCQNEINSIIENETKQKGEEIDQRMYEYATYQTKKNAWVITLPEYNIIRGPSKGTLLSFEQIKGIIINFTDVRIKSSVLRYVFPVQVNYREVYNMKEYLNKKLNKKKGYLGNEYDETKKKNLKKEDKGRDSYFYEYINKLLFDDTNSLRVELPSGELDDFINSKNIKKKHIFFHGFNYNLGFFVVYLEVNHNNSWYSKDYVIEINEQVDADKEQIHDKLYQALSDRLVNKRLFDKLKRLNENFIDRSYYTFQMHKLADNSFTEQQKLEFVKDICKCHTEKESLKDDINEWQVSKDVFCGFDTVGGFIAIKDSKYEIDKEWRDFDTKLYIFLLALQERIALLNITKELSYYKESKKAFRKVLLIRKRFISFLIDGKFKQVTNDRIGQQLYERWCEEFHIDSLYNEVDERLKSLYDFYQSTFSGRFEKVSAIFFPAITVCTFMQIIIDTNNKLQFSLLLTVGIIFIFCLLGVVVSKK